MHRIARAGTSRPVFAILVADAVVKGCGPLALDARYALNPAAGIPHLEIKWLRLLLHANPSRDDFAAMLDESFAGGNLQESSVIKGKVVAIEKDMAVIDVGLKTEGRVALREFNGPGRENDLKVGDEVEVFLDRIENALGEAVLSRDKARREESWGKLEKAFNANEKVTASSSIRSRVASPSISTALSPSCRARRWTSVRSATLRR
jgi:transcriptional accessory protein Tex/SPT6